MRITRLIALFLLSVFGLSLVTAQQPIKKVVPVKTHHVVITVTSADEMDWHIAMGNTKNLLNAFGTDPYEVEIVAFAPGINMVKKPSAAHDEMAALMQRGVKFVACENSMRAHNLTKADLEDNVGTVPSGIAEVVARQEQGWAYVKAGR